MAGEGVEVIVSVCRDSDFGPMLAEGLGGVLVEVLDDVVLSPAPVDAAEAFEMLRRLRGARVVLDPNVVWPLTEVLLGDTVTP